MGKIHLHLPPALHDPRTKVQFQHSAHEWKIQTPNRPSCAQEHQYQELLPIKILQTHVELDREIQYDKVREGLT